MDAEKTQHQGMGSKMPPALFFRSASIESISHSLVTSSTTVLGVPKAWPPPPHAKGSTIRIHPVDMESMWDRIETFQQMKSRSDHLGHLDAQFVNLKSRPRNTAPPAPIHRQEQSELGVKPGKKAEPSGPHQSANCSASPGNCPGRSSDCATCSSPETTQQVDPKHPSDIDLGISRDHNHDSPHAKTRTKPDIDSHSLPGSNRRPWVCRARNNTLTMSDEMDITPAGALDLADLHNRMAELEETQDHERSVSSPGRISYMMCPLDAQRNEDVGVLAMLPAAGDVNIVMGDESELSQSSQEARRLLREVKYEFNIEKKQRAQDVENAKQLRDDTPKTTGFRFSSQKSLDKALKRATAAFDRLAASFKPDEMPERIQAAMDAIKKLDSLLADDDNEVLDELIHERAKLVNDVHHAQQRMAIGKEAEDPPIQRLASIQKSVATFELRITMLETMWAQQSELAEKGMINERRTTMTVQKFLDSDPMIESAVNLTGDIVKDVNLHVKILEEKAASMARGRKHERHPLVGKLRGALVPGWCMSGSDSNKDGKLDAETFRMLLETAMSMDLEVLKWNLWDETA